MDAPRMTFSEDSASPAGACTPPKPCPYWLLTGGQTRLPAKKGRRKGPGRQSRFERTL